MNNSVKSATPSRVALLALVALAGPCRSELVFKKVWPDKIYYAPGEAAHFEVEISNPDAAPASAQLDVSLVRDLTSTVPLHSEAITVAPGQTKVWSLPWKAQPWLGVEVRATLQREGQQVALGQDYFTCARTVHQVWLPLQFDLLTGNQTRENFKTYVAGLAGKYRKYYSNGGEQFAWAPSDYDDLTPNTESYWSGQTQYHQNKSDLIAMYAAVRKAGVRAISYGRAAGAGPITFEHLRAQPELSMYEDGRPIVEIYDVAYMDFLKSITPARKDDLRPIPGTPEEMEKAGYAGAGKFAPYTRGGMVSCIVWYNANNDEVIRHGSEEFGKSAMTFGFDGVRFDGEFANMRIQRLDGSWTGPPGFDTDAADVRMIRNMKKITWGYKPGYLFGYNTHVDFRWNIKNNTVPLAYREKCKDDGLIAREEMAFPGNVPWNEYIKVVRHDSDLARYYGGHSSIYPLGRDSRYLYCYIVPFALRAHVMYAPQTTLPLHKFATRMASVLWDEGLHTWAQAADNVEVKASRELWWKPFAAARSIGTAGNPKTQFVLHLINPPESKTTLGVSPTPAGSDVDAMPAAPATDIVVRWRKPRGFKRAMLADLNRDDMQEVPTETDGEWLVLKIPSIEHWSILVIEANTPTPPAVWELSAEDANLKTLNAQDLSIAPVTGKQAKWNLTVQSEDLTYASDVSTLTKELDARGGASLHAAPGGRRFYMGTAYAFPRMPGEYSATFRLKVKDNTDDKPVVQISIGHQVDIELPGVPRLDGTPLVLRGTDFKEPNVYQDFTVTFKVNDVGFRYYDATYLQHGDVWWDQTTLQLVRPWTSEELAATYAGFKAPPDLQLQRDDTFDIFMVRGLWHDLYRLDEAASKLGSKVKVTDSYTAAHSIGGLRLAGPQIEWASLFKQDVLVLANVETRTLPFGQFKIIQQWVKQGGSLVVLGGLQTLGQADNMKFGWPEMLPVQLKMPYEVARSPLPVAFGSTSKLPGLQTIGWKQPPVLLYRHMVKPKPNAKVLLYGKGGAPLWVGGAYGKGHVVVFTGTVLGNAPKGSTAFWNAPLWPAVMASAIRWSRDGK